MKKIVTLFLILLSGTFSLFAQPKDGGEWKPVTSKWSVTTGVADYACHYLNNQEYSGNIRGFEAQHGRYFKKSDKLSWKLTLRLLSNTIGDYSDGALTNAANTSYITAESGEADYAVFYNWLTNNRLQLRAGGSLNAYRGRITGDGNSVNNNMTYDFQAQINGALQIRYGWDFKKFGMDIYANAAFPLFGLMEVDERYESSTDEKYNENLSVGKYSHIVFSSLHNAQGMNFEMGVDFALRRLSLCLGVETRNRWWNAYELQNYRKNTLLKLGVSVNFVSLKTGKTGDRKF